MDSSPQSESLLSTEESVGHMVVLRNNFCVNIAVRMPFVTVGVTQDISKLISTVFCISDSLNYCIQY